jgi:hypothetical protein
MVIPKRKARERFDRFIVTESMACRRMFSRQKMDNEKEPEIRLFFLLFDDR